MLSKGIINTNKELKRINDKKDKLLSQLSEVESKLKNSLFIAKAPQGIVDEFKNKEIDIKSSIEKIDQIINTIN